MPIEVGLIFFFDLIFYQPATTTALMKPHIFFSVNALKLLQKIISIKSD